MPSPRDLAMGLYRSFRILTLGLMVASLLVLLLWPDLADEVRRLIAWAVPAWIVLLFLVQMLVTPASDGTTPLEALLNRLGRRTWTCPRCGRAVPLHVKLCRDCCEVRPEPPWRCEVCGETNPATAAVCRRCKAGGAEARV